MTSAAPKILAKLSPIEDIIEAARQGKMFLLVDDEGRENEGDIAVVAQDVTPEMINFMIRECGGMICLAMEGAMIDKLDLPLQPRRNLIGNQAHFTISIEAREGVETGVSAKDRAHTIRLAVAPETGPDDICTPGHVFPLRAFEGGVLSRAGHTEACVDVAKLAGKSGAAVICEVMNEDGTMARLPDLLAFAARHNILIGTIEDLINYRKSK